MSPRRCASTLETDPETSQRLGRVRQKGTKPELEVRRVIHVLGHRFRIDNRDLPGSPDVANRARRWVVFVHGCFWHQHPGCRRATVPKRNHSFWVAKFEANRRRDRRVAAALRRQGYTVMTTWECEARVPERLSRRLERLLGTRYSLPRR
jgi:DNA mismatch endonuclease, patch repair protein